MRESTSNAPTASEHTWALDVHEVRVRRLYQTFELVPASLRGGGRVKEIDGESLQGDGD